MKRLVVVGNGMAGIACVEQILKHEPEFEISVFGDETHVNYNRILLSSVLAGEKEPDEIILNDIDWYRRHGIELRLGVRVHDIDRANRVVHGNDGSSVAYDRIILATGSNPSIPAIEGKDKEGVYVFRTMDDTRNLISRASSGLRAVVIGGGLLGLEAARGLQVRGCDVTVVHRSKNLMSRQLDATGGHFLQRAMEQLGLRVLLHHQTAAVLGNGHVEGVRFADGKELEAELVVIAAGIRPNMHLAKAAGLEVRDGIIVNDYLQTSDPRIFAVGECTEHRGVTFGLVAPLYEQAKVLAAHITGNDTSPFEGATLATRLKIMGVDVFSAGAFEEREPGIEVVRYEDAALGIYKKLLIKDNRLYGVILVGDTSDEMRYKNWLRTGEDLSGQRRTVVSAPY